MSELAFRVAEATFVVRFEDLDDGRSLLPSYAPFYVKEPTEAPMFTMVVGDNAADDSLEGEEVGQFDCGGANNGVYRIEDGYKMLVSDIHGKLCCAFTARKSFSDCRARLYGTHEEQKYGLNNAMMIAFAFAGAMRNILLMHASVPMKDEKAYLFLGSSGTGKSTHSRLWLEHVEDADLLNDDNPAVRIAEDGAAFVYGTPWSGKTPCYRNLRRTCGGFLRLQQYPKNIIRRDSGIKAFASILSSCSTMIWDKPSYRAICDTCAKLAERVPCYHLKNRPERDAARLSYNSIAR